MVAEPAEQKQNPKNVVDAQFSTPFGAAIALVHGAADFNQFTPANITDPIVRDLMARTECYSDPAFDTVYPQQWPAAVQIELRDGRTVSTQIEHATGEPENPVKREQLIDKFVMLTEPVLGATDAGSLASRIVELDAEADLREVMRLIRS